MLHEVHITTLLKESRLIEGDINFSPINDGASGAVVLLCNNQYVVKYAHSSIIDTAIMNQFRYEYAFYEQYARHLDFLPEVVFQTANDDELLLVFRKYEAISPERWDSALQQQAMEICARINALDCVAYSNPSSQKSESERGQYTLMKSYENWHNLHNKFPAQLNASVLKEMYDNFYKIEEYAEGLLIPNTFCHGDFAGGNFLLDGTRLLVCDWQYTHIGKGIGAVAYFCDRGIDLGWAIDRDSLIACYSEELREKTGVMVTIDTLTQYAKASTWLLAFRYWAEYLQDSNAKRVAGIYTGIVEKYIALQKYI